MQRTRFYRFRFFLGFSGNAEALLLPFSVLSHIFGQCRGPAFTVFGSFSDFRSMQRTCFYRFRFFLTFSGNAEDPLLPFSVLSHIFGQCRGPAFTVFGSFSHFWAMQRTCFYRFESFSHSTELLTNIKDCNQTCFPSILAVWETAGWQLFIRIFFKTLSIEKSA
jgi:hypothetical protein